MNKSSFVRVSSTLNRRQINCLVKLYYLFASVKKYLNYFSQLYKYIHFLAIKYKFKWRRGGWGDIVLIICHRNFYHFIKFHKYN